MRKRLLAIGVVVALGLAGCSSSRSIEGAAEKCGGEAAGITVSDGVLEYDQSQDASNDAWTCVLSELVPNETDQYTITQTLDEGLDAQDGTFGSLSAVWAVNASRGIQLAFWPTM